MAAATGAKVATPAPPVPKSGDVASPGKALKGTGPSARDPRFQRLLAQVQRNAAKQKKHPSAAQKAAEAQRAAVPPANERTAGAKANSVDTMQEAKAEKPKTDGFLAMLRAEIEKVMPKTLDDTQNFMGGGAKDGVKNAVKGGVQESKADAAGPVEEAATAAPDPGAVPSRAPAPAPDDPAAPPEALDARNAVPVPKSDADISQKKKADDADAKMKEAEVTDTQLKKANDPRFSAVVDAKGDVKAKVAAAPGQYRKGEKAALSAGVAKALADGRTGAAQMIAQRARGGTQVKSRQQLAKERDEKRRKAVTDKIESIYTNTKTRVEEKLTSLETDVMAAFDAGMNAALASMKSWSDREIKKFKDERYSGIDGGLRWVADLFRPCPEGIKVILREAKTRFSTEMDALAVKISTTVDTRLAEAKKEIQKGQQEIASYVATLPADLKSVGQAAQTEVQGRFKELEDGIEAKKQSLAQGLAQKYKEAHDKADAELKKIEEANAGALKKFADKLGEIIKIIAEFKDKLMAVLRKGWATIKLILADPIGFLGNLITAIKGGVMAFVSNFGKWLMKGLAQWLFGNLASAGISMPSDLSLPSIFKLVMQLLGITYANIRAKAVRLVGEPVVKAIEVMAEFVQVFIRGGPAALWAHIKEQLSDLKSMVIDAIIGWVTQTIITQAATKLLSMFNPAGAFVQACIAIYNVVMFLIERASQILAFIEAIVNSVHAIATGSIGGAIAWIERSLGAMVPLVISFLARLIGLGGITAKIVGIIKKVQAKVDKAIDWVLAKIVNGLKKLVRGVTGGGKADTRTPAEKQRDLDRAAAAVRPQVQSMMRGGVMRAVLRARLMIWKRQYKLTELDVQVQGGKPRIVAKINPEVTIVEGVTVDDNMLLAIVTEVANELKTDRRNPQFKTRTVAASRRMSSQARSPTETGTGEKKRKKFPKPRMVSIPGSDLEILPAAYDSFRKKKKERAGIRVGGGVSGVMDGTLSRALNKDGRAGTAHTYVDMIGGIQASGMTPQQLGAIMRTPGQKPPRGTPPEVGELILAQHISERLPTRRAPESEVFNIMHANMMGQPGGTDFQGFLQNNPAAMENFVAANQAARKGLTEDPATEVTAEQVTELRRRKVATIVQWLKMEMTAGRLELTTDRDKLKAAIKKMVRDFYDKQPA